MRKVVFAINITADGYCGHTDVAPDDAVLSYFTRRLHDMGLIIFGRTTYELMVPYWPDIARNPSESEADKAFAHAFEALDKVVFSTTLKRVEGDKTRLVRAGVAEEVLALKQQPGKVIGVGSLSIASQLSDRGLIDEYHFVVHPVVVGKGPRLFETMNPQNRLQLDFIGLESFQSGVVVLHYRKHT
jgi:dihydrofolate reductase